MNDYNIGEDMSNYGLNNYFDVLAPTEVDSYGQPVSQNDSINFTTYDIGTTTTPMGHIINERQGGLKAKIREGVGRIEFSFMGQNKGNSQQSTPESYGRKERRDIRELLEINKIDTSTHAAVHSQSLAGFGEGGFNEERRADVLKEIKKAIDFASEATKGGAVVFHLTEWQRNLTDLGKGDKVNFVGFEGEHEKSPMYVVDSDTGAAISRISRDKKIYRLAYETVRDYETRTGKKIKGENVHPDDWVDVYGNKIDRNASTDKLFNRVPKWKSDEKTFEVQEIDWDTLKKETDEFNKGKPKKDQITPEVMYARIELENQIHQARGSSLFHARDYQSVKQQRDTLKSIKENYEKLKKGYSDERKEEAKFWLKKALDINDFSLPGFDIDPEKELQKKLDYANDTLRHTHEASGSSDVRAKELQKSLSRLKSVEEYGLDRTAQTIADAAMYAKEKYEANKEKYGLEKPLFVAPENWDPRAFGSHPEEYRKAIDASRNKMMANLKKRGYGDVEAEVIAKKHIKGTLDIGHLNTYRKYVKKKPGESEEKMNERFEDWLIEESEKLVKGGYVGHIHLSDNLGFDDEHLSPGEGNVPMKRFIEKMKEFKDKKMIDSLIVEPGSFNGTTAMTDTLAYINSPIFGMNRKTNFGMMRQAHFGANNPGFFIAGAYSPSNKWKLWTDVPLE